MTSTLKADLLQAKTTDGAISIKGDGTGKVSLGDANLLWPDADGSSSGDVLQTNASGVLSFATPSAGAWSVIQTVDVTAVSSIEFTGFNSSTYSHYQFWIQDIAIDSNNNLRMRTSSDGGSSYDTGASDYQWVHGRVRGGSTDQGWDETDENIELAGDGNMEDWDTDNNSFFSAVLNVFSPADTRETSFTWVAGWIGGGGDLNCGYYSATRKSTADVDAIKFYPASGAFKALGTIKMLGMAI